MVMLSIYMENWWQMVEIDKCLSRSVNNVGPIKVADILDTSLYSALLDPVVSSFLLIISLLWIDKIVNISLAIYF